MPQPEEEKVSVAFEAKSKARALEAQAQRFHAMASQESHNSPGDIRMRFIHQQVAYITPEEGRLLLSQIKTKEHSKKQVLVKRKALIDDHIASIRRTESQLLQLEAQLPGFTNDSHYGEYASTKQAATDQLNALELSLLNDLPPKRNAIKQSILKVWKDYETCYALVRQFLNTLVQQSSAQQALSINLQGAHIEGSAGAKIQTLIIQTEAGARAVIDEIKKTGELEAKIKVQDDVLAKKDVEIAELQEKIKQAKQEPEQAEVAQATQQTKEEHTPVEDAATQHALEKVLQTQAAEHAKQMEEQKAKTEAAEKTEAEYAKHFQTMTEEIEKQKAVILVQAAAVQGAAAEAAKQADTMKALEAKLAAAEAAKEMTAKLAVEQVDKAQAEQANVLAAEQAKVQQRIDAEVQEALAAEAVLHAEKIKQLAVKLAATEKELAAQQAAALAQEKLKAQRIEAEKKATEEAEKIKQLAEAEQSAKAQAEQQKKAEDAAEDAQRAAYELERERKVAVAAEKQRVAQGLSNELVLACEQGDEKAVEALLLRGADPSLENEKGVHPLGAAVWGMNPEVVNQLIAAMGGVASMSWEECEAHNKKHYHEVFMFTKFAPTTCAQWHVLLLKMDRSPFLAAQHLEEHRKLWGKGNESWQDFVRWVERMGRAKHIVNEKSIAGPKRATANVKTNNYHSQLSASITQVLRNQGHRPK